MCMYILMFFHDVAANQFYQTQLHVHLDSVWFRLAFVCMRLKRLLFDLYVMIPGQTRLHRLSISFGTYIQLHNFARFLLGKRDWLWILSRILDILIYFRIRHSFAHLRPVIFSADWSIRRLQSWTCSSLSTVAEFVKLTQSIVIEI